MTLPYCRTGSCREPEGSPRGRRGLSRAAIAFFLAVLVLMFVVLSISGNGGVSKPVSAPSTDGALNSSMSVPDVRATHQPVQATPEQPGSSVPQVDACTLIVEVLRGDVPAGAGARVEFRDAAQQSSRYATTDPLGLARFEGVLAGQGLVILHEFSSGRVELSDVFDDPSEDPAVEGQNLNPPLYRLVEIPAQGEVRIRIAIHAPGAVVGALIGPFAEPLPETQVVLVFEGAAMGRFERTTLTDADGSFAFAGVMPGAYRLQAFIAPARELRDLQGRLMLQNAAPPRTSVVVEPGETAHVLLALGQGPHELRGRVVDTLGRPVPALHVLVWPAAQGLGDASRGDPLGTNWSDSVASLTTDAAGDFSASGVRPGVYRVLADPYGNVPGRLPGTTRLAHWVTPAEVNVDGREQVVRVAPIVVPLSQPCTLRSRVRFDAGWRHVDSSELDELRVQARMCSGHFGRDPKRYPWQVRVSPDGAFEIVVERGGLPPSDCAQLEIEHSRSGTSKSIDVRMSGEDVQVLPDLLFP